MFYEKTVNSYKEKCTARRNLEKRIERAEKRLEKSGYVSWIDEIVKPLAEALRKKLNKKQFDILGPFGLSCETSIWFFDTDKQRKNCKVKSITFRPGNLERGELQVETDKKKQNYNEGTIGAVNGGNIVCERVPKNASLEWFLKRVK